MKLIKSLLQERVKRQRDQKLIFLHKYDKLKNEMDQRMKESSDQLKSQIKF
jgi:hypothetical protein